MSQYLTYAAVRSTDLDSILKQCTKAAEKLGIRFEVPFGPSDEAHTWIGVFDNGWIFALADPAVWELPSVFARLARAHGYEILTGSTDGELDKWSYEYTRGTDVLHKFVADPSTRYAEHDYPSLRGNADALAETFSTSMPRLRAQLRQFRASSVNDFLQTLGFEISRASSLRFIIIAKGKMAAVSTLSVPAQGQGVSTDASPSPASGTGVAGVTTKAYKIIKKTADGGYGTAAGMRALRFGEESDFNEAHDLFFRIRRDRRHEICLQMADSLVERFNNGEFDDLPSPHREIRGTTIFGLRGIALYDLQRYDEAIYEFRDRSLGFNRYMGPQHRARIAGYLGDALIKTRHYEDATEWLQLALAQRPLHAASWANLANAQRRSGKVEQARQAVLQGIAAQVDHEAWPALKASLNIRERELLPPRRPERARQYRHDAQGLMQGGDKRRAVAQFRIALHHAPEDLDCAWGVACAIAECYREGLLPIDDARDAVRLLEQVCFGNPTWPWAWGTLTELHERLGRHDLATKAAEAYAKLHATKLEDLQNVAIWLANLYPELGVVMLGSLVDRFVELRLTGMGSTVDRDQAKFKALSMLGWALLATGKPQEAIQPLTEALSLDGDSVDNRANLAAAHQQLGNEGEALRIVNRGLRIDPRHERLLELQRQLRA